MRSGAVGGIIAALFVVVCAAAAAPGGAGPKSDQAAPGGTAQGSVLLPFVGKSASVHPEAPQIEIVPPRSALHARRTYTLTVRVSDANNNLSHVAAEQQLGMGDRYTGTEYVTSQQLPYLVLDGDNLVAKADYPGNYRVWVRAVDSTGLTGEASVDLGVYWAPGENPFEFRGICDGGFTPDTIDEVILVLDRMLADGANYVQVNPLAYMETAESTDIRILPGVWSPGEPGHTYSDEMLVQVIEAAHQRGLKVMIKPQIQIGNWETGSWQIAPSDWDAWFDSYYRLMEHYARIAQETGSESLCVGNELISTHSEVESWSNIVRDIRRIFDGQLTYSDLYLMGIWHEYSGFPVWDQLDVIGLSYYPGGTGLETPDPPNTNPSVEVMEQNIIRKILNRAQAAHQLYGLDVIATESGAASYYDGINFEPGSNTYPPDAVPDLQEVVDYFEARHRAIATLSSWFKGSMEWRMQMRDPPWSPPGSIFPPDIRDQPVEHAMRFWYGGTEQRE